MLVPGLGILFAVLALAGGLLYRRRLEAAKRLEGGDFLSDELIRQIETSGRIELEEPLDLKEIRAEEEQFWSETWDEPEEP